MYEDDVLREVWQVKDSIAAQYHYDVRELAVALREIEQMEGINLVSFPPKRPLSVKQEY